MDLIQNYKSSSEEEEEERGDKEVVVPETELAPEVDIEELKQDAERRELEKFEKRHNISTTTKHLTGYVEDYYLTSATFDEQFHKFRSHGFAADPSDERHDRLVFSSAVQARPGVDIMTATQRKKLKREIKAQRKRGGDASDNSFLGPWAGYADERIPQSQTAEETEIQEQRLKRFEKMRKEKHAEIVEKIENPELEKELPNPEITAIFHGSEVHDYKGKSFVQAPGYLKHETKALSCFIPKKWIHSYNGHSKAVQVVRFIKPYGHLALSASHDTKLKLWDVLTNRRCVMTYVGHEAPIRDICFNYNGTRFLSASFDRLIHLWDTETGKVIKTLSNKKIPYCVLFHPDKDKQNVVMAGSENKKVIQWDASSGEIVHQYEEHMGPINTVTFIDNNKRFVTTADDKKIFIWEWGIPVVFKHIMDPDMFPITKAVVHPNGKYYAGSSMNNKIMIYDVKGGFKLNRKKLFAGHNMKAHPCGLSFSPDGQFLCAGDSLGKLWFWDWKSTKNYRTIQAHDGVCIECEWHPVESSKVVTCGFDSSIKLWD